MVVTTYYNPKRYKLRRKNYDIFINLLKDSGIPTLTVECAFGDDEFELPADKSVFQIRSQSLLWQKERLLNLWVEQLPRKYKYIAWIDCDVIFLNKNWAVDTVKLLKEYKVVQCFKTALRLKKNYNFWKVQDRIFSFGTIAPHHTDLLDCGRYDLHGHTGFAWAMRREIFDKVWLYDHAIIWSADHFMAHACFNTYGFCIHQALQNDKKQIRHLEEWGSKFYQEVQWKITSVPWELYHLRHGNQKDRQYVKRMEDITRLGFDPYTDLCYEEGKPVEWSKNIQKEELKAYFSKYFESRREDGRKRES